MTDNRNTMFREVGYAYPTSTYAFIMAGGLRTGCYKTGAWYCGMQKLGAYPSDLTGPFPTREAATDAAAAKWPELPWSRYSMHSDSQWDQSAA